MVVAALRGGSTPVNSVCSRWLQRTGSDSLAEVEVLKSCGPDTALLCSCFAPGAVSLPACVSVPGVLAACVSTGVLGAAAS